MADTGLVLNPATARVLHNMARRMQESVWRIPEDVTSRQELEQRRLDFRRHHAEMATSFAQAIDYVATPGVRLWPDNGREDCLSLSGSLHGLGFGIIWHPNADGTGTWGFHS